MVYNRNDASIGRSLDRYGEFSQGEPSFQQVVGIGDVVIEVGADIGAHTLRLAQLAGPGGRVPRVRAAASGLPDALRQPRPELDREYPLLSVYGGQPGGGAAGPGGRLRRAEQLRGDRAGRRRGVEVGRVGGLLRGRAPGHPRLSLRRPGPVAAPEGQRRGDGARGPDGGPGADPEDRPFLYVENDRPAKSEALVDLLRSLGYDLYWHDPLLYNTRTISGTPRTCSRASSR